VAKIAQGLMGRLPKKKFVLLHRILDFHSFLAFSFSFWFKVLYEDNINVSTPI
jgi:hypothetical protein